MQYLVPVYTDESIGPAPDSTDEEVMWAAHEIFSRAMEKFGAMVAGWALHPSDTATTVRCRDGATLTSDGPLSPTVEQLAGFYLIEAERSTSSARCPTGTAGSAACLDFGTRPRGIDPAQSFWASAHSSARMRSEAA